MENETINYMPKEMYSIEKYMSDEIDLVVSALIRVQQEMDEPKKNCNGNNGPYANLESILATAKPKCSEHGILIYLHHRMRKDGIYVYSILFHSSGQWLKSCLKADPDEQIAYDKEIEKNIDPNDEKEKKKKKFLTYWQLRSTAFTYTKRHLIETQLSIDASEENDRENQNNSQEKFKKVETKTDNDGNRMVSQPQLNFINVLIERGKGTMAEILEDYKIESLEQLQIGQAKNVIDKMTK